MKSKDFKIVKKKNYFYVLHKKPILYFFNKWIELTWDDGFEETSVSFETHDEASSFIKSFAD